MIMDFVGRFETFEQGVHHIAKHLDLGEIVIPHANRTEHRPYSAYYTAETRDLVASRFQRDIDAFGYDFETV